MARTVDDVALLLEVLMGRTGIVERVDQGIPGLHIGVARTWRTGHPATDDLFDWTIGRLVAAGATVHDVAAYLPTRGDQGPQDLAEVIAYEKHHAAVELAHFGHELFERAAELGGSGTDAYRSARARNLAWALGTCLEPAFAGIDALVAPTYGPAWKSDLVLGGHLAVASPITTAPSIAGWPIATTPMGLVEDLPVGFGVIGRPGSEALLLAVCRAVEQPARPTWRPPRRG
jgi:amidase